MLENETGQMNSTSTGTPMKDGEEPTEVLLALVSSPLLAIQARGMVRILLAKDDNGKSIVLAMFNDVTWDESVGIKMVPTESK